MIFVVDFFGGHGGGFFCVCECLCAFPCMCKNVTCPVSVNMLTFLVNMLTFLVNMLTFLYIKD